jgi:hypothetical protein
MKYQPFRPAGLTLQAQAVYRSKIRRLMAASQSILAEHPASALFRPPLQLPTSRRALRYHVVVSDMKEFAN